MYIKNSKSDQSKNQKNDIIRKKVPHISLFDNINQIAYVADPKTYEILYVNTYFEKLLGENPIGKKCYEVFHNIEYPCSFCTNKKILNEKGKPYEWEHYNPVLKKSYLITDQIIKWSDGRDVRFEFAIDITKLKNKELKLQKTKQESREHAEELEKLMDLIPAAVWISKDSNCNVILGNKKANEFYDALEDEHVSESSIDGEKEFNFKNKKELNPIELSMHKAACIGKDVKHTELDMLTPSKKKISLWGNASPLFDEMGNVRGSIAAFLDISEQKKLQERIRKSEERLRLAQKAAEIGTWDWNIPTNELIWSEEIKDIFGIDPDDFEGTYDSFLGYVHPDDRRFVKDSVYLCLKEDKEYDIEHRIIHPDGSVHWVRENGDVIRDSNGDPLRMIGIVQEITQRKQNEKKITRLNYNLLHQTAELSAVNKELEAFSYSVSHDLRSPLRSIDGFSQALLEDYEELLDDEGKDYLNRIRKATSRMAELIEGLLKLSRITRHELEIKKINISKMSETIIDSFKKNNPKRNVNVTIHTNLVTNADKHLVQIAIENLIGNAWKFTNKKEKAHIEIGKTRKNGIKTFFIKDNGAGFNLKYADKLFTSFQRFHTVDEFEGNGIGLGIVSRVINKHGGDIWVDSEVGKGTTFYFTFEKEKNEG